MMKTYRVIAALFVLMISGIGRSQDQSEFSLIEAEDYGVTKNVKTRNAALDYDVAIKKVWETTALGLPQVNIEGSFLHYLDIPISVIDAQAFNPTASAGEIVEVQFGQTFSTSAVFNVSQLLFDGSYLVALKFSKFYQSMSTTAIELSKQEVKGMVRQAYYNALVAKESVRLMDSIVATTAQIRDQTVFYEEVGLINEEEVLQIDLAYNQVVSNRKTYSRQVDVATYLLKLSMGYDLDKEIVLTEDIVDILVETLSVNPAEQGGDVKKNSAYILMDQQITLDGYSIKNEKAAYYPSLGAFFTHSQNAYRNDFDFFANKPWYPTTIWGISLKIPVTSSGMKWARVQQAEIKLEKDQNSLTALEKTLKFQEFRLKSAYDEALDQMILSKANVDLARKLFKNQLQKKSDGVSGALQVTQLQSQLLTSEAGYIGAIMQLLTAKVELDKLYNK